MARPKASDSLEACNEEIETLQKKLAAARQKRQKLEQKDNLKLGELVRQTFGDVLSGDKEEREAFFSNLRKLYDENQVIAPVHELEIAATTEDENPEIVVTDETEDNQDNQKNEDAENLTLPGSEDNSMSGEQVQE